MDEKTRLLISLAASVATNCVPCFQHFLGRTQAVGLTSEEILDAVEIADQVKNGARITITSTIRGMIGAARDVSPCDRPSDKSCCG